MKKFELQDEYYAVSVSEPIVNTGRAYIRIQEDHHNANTFQKEYESKLAMRKNTSMGFLGFRSASRPKQKESTAVTEIHLKAPRF